MGSERRLADDLAGVRAKAGQWNDLFEDFIAALARVGVGRTAPRVGTPFPAFALPDAGGHYRSLDGLLAKGPLVLSFNRGGWCPYCATELRAWNAVLPDLAERGASFAAVTPEVGGRAALMGRLLDLSADAELLCDVDSGVALTLGLAFRLTNHIVQTYHKSGLDVVEVYGSGSGFLPVPATFVIDRDGTTLFSFADPDFRHRAEPTDVLAALDQI